MPYSDLRAWMAALERAGQLKRVRAEVDPILEVTEITDRISKGSHRPSAVGDTVSTADGRRPTASSGGPALLFENLKGHSGSKLLINQFGSARRMKMALGVDSLDEVADRIRALLDVKSPQGLMDKLKMLPMLADMGAMFPKTVPSGPCKE